MKQILELEFQTEDKIKPYADFILITMLPHSDGNQAWQSWISLERQVRNAYDASKRCQANEYEYESKSQSQYNCRVGCVAQDANPNTKVDS